MGTRISITPLGGSRRAASHYGTREIEDKLPSKHAGSQGTQKLTLTFSYDDLPVVGLDEAILRLPANSRIKSATLRVVTALAGTTPTVTIGVTEPDGSTIDADGIDVAIAAAALSVVGETVKCNGALVDNTDGIGSEAGQIVVTTGGTVTAGKFTLDVEYEELFARA